MRQFVLIFLVVTISSCFKNHDQVEFDFTKEYKDDIKNRFGVLFDPNRDSILIFEVFNEFNGDLIGNEVWQWTREYYLPDSTKAYEYTIKRYYERDHRTLTLTYTKGNTVNIYDRTYQFPVIDGAFSHRYSFDTLQRFVMPGTFDRVYKAYAPAKQDYVNGKVNYIYHYSVDSIPAGGNINQQTIMIEDFYYADKAGLMEMRQSYWKYIVPPIELSRIKKVRVF